MRTHPEGNQCAEGSPGRQGANAVWLRLRLLDFADPERAVHEKRYLKGPLAHLGVSVPRLRRVAKELLQSRPDLPREELLDLATELWSQGIHEHRMVAVEILCARSRVLDTSDAAFLERLLRESGTWALVDTLAAHVVGSLAERFPAFGEPLDRWAADTG